jgi:hypothetical protein
VKYMALIYTDPASWEPVSEEEQKAIYQRYVDLTEEARTAGVYVSAAQLGSTGDATTVRIRDRETLVTDGPYAEVKEALGGYYLFDCASFDEALDWAAKIPAAARGAVEVRALYVDDEEGAAA